MMRHADQAYRAHRLLLTDARQYPELWRLFLGLMLVVVVVIAMNGVLLSVLVGLGPADSVNGIFDGSSPVAVLLLLSSFGFITLGVAVAARVAQHRGLTSILGPVSLLKQQFRAVLWALFLLGFVLTVLPPYDFGTPLEPNLPLSRWLLLLPLSATAVLIQTSAEEILFRGYLQQCLAVRFNSRVIWMGVPSLLFAIGHFDPLTTGDNALLVSLWAFVFGILTADLTARAGTLGPAIALHFLNNFTALLLISLPDNISGLALYHIPFDPADTESLRPWLFVDFAIMFVGWLTVRLVLRR